LKGLCPYLLVLALVIQAKVLAQEQDQHQPSTINIGLLLPDPSHAYVSRIAEQAVRKANKSGGYQHQEFKLVVRTAEGLWGAGSKESVALVYEDEVCAIVGSLDGRNAHLAEQVAAKSHLAYIEAHATEPTLSQAFVPWFFRVVPNDDQQAQALVELIQKNGGGKIGVLSNDTYDARYAVQSLQKETRRKTGDTPLVIDVNSLDRQSQKIIREIQSSRLEHLVVPFDAPYLHDLLVSLRKHMPSVKIYGTLHFTMGAEIRKIRWQDYEGIYLISAGPIWIGDKYLWHNAREGSASDAVNLVIEAVKQVGTDREAIQDYLSEIHFNEGVTGHISFDEMGNRTRRPVLTRIEQGKRIPIPYR